jgi:hypothetical protein
MLNHVYVHINAKSSHFLFPTQMIKLELSHCKTLSNQVGHMPQQLAHMSWFLHPKDLLSIASINKHIANKYYGMGERHRVW